MNDTAPERHRSRTPRRAPLLVALAATLFSGVHAQAILKCRIDGRVVFQSSPCPLEARASVALATVPLPASRAAPTAPGQPAAPRKKTLADVLRERDGNDPVGPEPPAFRSDGADVLRARMGAI
jgi:hypothetical protein